MSSFVYIKGLASTVGSGDFWGLDTVRFLLERSTSAYAPNIDHDFLDDFTAGGGVEITVASYARQTLGGKVTIIDGVDDRVELDGNDLAFGNLETGQTVKALIGYRRVGVDDTTPADDDLLLYYDGKFNIYLAAAAALSATTIYVDPLPCTLANGTALDFGGGATCTLGAEAALGARALTVSALGAAAAAAAVSANVPCKGNILPFVLGGGAFTVVIDAQGLIQLKPRN